MGKILVTSSHWDTLCQEAAKMLADAGHEVVVHRGDVPYLPHDELIKVIADIDGAISGLDQWTEDIYAAAPKLKVIAKFGVGTDNMDKPAARKYGIKVINAPGINSNAVAELTIGMIVDMLRGVTMQHRAMTQGRWPRFLGEELRGKTVGLLGFGAIAKLVAKKLQCFDVTVIASDLYPDLETANAYNVQIVSSEEVITRSDIVSIHIPSTPQTYHMFNDELFAKMKPGAYLVNAARGAIVDSDALVRALESGRLAGAALDALEKEPLPPDDPLLTCSKTVCTCHTGAETREIYQNVSVCVAQGVIDVLEGREPKFWVNR